MPNLVPVQQVNGYNIQLTTFNSVIVCKQIVHLMSASVYSNIILLFYFSDLCEPTVCMFFRVSHDRFIRSRQHT